MEREHSLRSELSSPKSHLWCWMWGTRCRYCSRLHYLWVFECIAWACLVDFTLLFLVGSFCGLFVVVLVEPYGLFFCFASFSVRAKIRLRASQAGADHLWIDVYKAHLEEGLGDFCVGRLDPVRVLSLENVYVYVLWFWPNVLCQGCNFCFDRMCMPNVNVTRDLVMFHYDAC